MSCGLALNSLFSSYNYPLYFGSNSTIHSIPYLSLKQPKYEPQGLSPIGPSICPPTESPLNGTLADYIPFYPGAKIADALPDRHWLGGHSKIPTGRYYLLYHFTGRGQIGRPSFFFTDGHDRSRTSTAYTDEADLQKLDWDAIYATNWKSDESDLRRKEKKQSEFFVKSHMPFSCMEHIGVFNKTAEQKVLYLFNSHSINTPIKISPERLYYDHL